MVLNGQIKSKMAEMLLFLADRAEHYSQVILQNKDKIIISDRSLISGVAYAKNISLQTAISLNLMIFDDVSIDKIIFLEISEKELQKRLSMKKNDTIESRGIKYLLDIQNRMKEVVDMLNIEYIIIDATLHKDKIAQQIDKFINN